MRPIREIITALGLCSAIPGPQPDGKHVCDACPYCGDCNAGNELLADAAELLAAFQWRDPLLDTPKTRVPVIVARSWKEGNLKVEQGMYLGDGRWRVYGTNVKRVVAWMSLPEPPQEGETV